VRYAASSGKGVWGKNNNVLCLVQLVQWYIAIISVSLITLHPFQVRSEYH
jgi:hypothetical protein